MKPVGPIIKKHIEDCRLVKKQIAENVGITPSYLSDIFKEDTIDAALLEKICSAIGLSPIVFFDLPLSEYHKHFSDINAKTKVGDATVRIGSDELGEKLLKEKERVIEILQQHLQEKERTIQILLKSGDQKAGSELGQTL